MRVTYWPFFRNHFSKNLGDQNLVSENWSVECSARKCRGTPSKWYTFFSVVILSQLKGCIGLIGVLLWLVYCYSVSNRCELYWTNSNNSLFKCDKPDHLQKMFSNETLVLMNTIFSAGSYGSLARFRSLSRLMKVNENTVIGASGDIADFQFIQETLKQKM